MTESIIGRELPTDAAFGEIAVGMRVTSAAVEPVEGFDGAAGLALLSRLVATVVPCRDASLAELTWEQPGRAAASGPVRLVATVSRWGADTGKGMGRIVQDLRLVDGGAAEVQRARARWRVPSVDIGPDPKRLAFDFGSVAWGKRIGERLAKNDAFRSATGSFDGAIGFSAGSDEVQFRIYRGQIIEISRKAIDGGTFTIDSSELSWLQVLTDEKNDFVRRTMTQGGFKVRGDGFQYVRMIKTIMLIVDEARAEVAEVLSA